METRFDLGPRSRRLEELAVSLAALQEELDELSGGEVDAVLPPAAAGGLLLLPGAQLALLRQEQEFRALVEHSPDPITRFDPAGRILYANPAMEALLERGVDALRGGTLGDARSRWRGLSAWSALVETVASRREPCERELVLRGRRGEVRAYTCRFHPEFGAEGWLESVLAISRDTTLRHTAEAEVRHAREFLQASIDALSAHVAVVDGAGRIVAVNQAWRRFGEAGGGAAAGPGHDYLAACERGIEGEDASTGRRAAAGIRAVLSGAADSFAQEYACATPAGDRWFQLRVTPLVSRGGRHAVVAHEDTTAEHTARAEAEAERDGAVHILESITDAFFTLDAEWRFQYLNPQTEPLLRRRRDELVGRVIWDEFPETVGSDSEREYRVVARSGIASTFETYYPPLEAWFEVNAYPNDGGVSVYFRDVTARHLREREAAALTERLAEERSLLEAVVEQLPVGVVIAEAPSGRLVMGNRQVAEIWRHDFVSAGSLAEYGGWEGYHADGRRVRAEEWPLARAIRTGHSVVDETYEIVRPDGVRGTARLSATPVADARGEVVAAVVVIADVTGETAAGRALQASEERYRLLFGATHDVLWDWDAVRDVVEWNESLAMVLLHPPSEERARLAWWKGHIHPDDRARTSVSLDAALHGTGLGWTDEFRFERGDGSYAHVLARASLLRGPDGQAVRMIGSMLDLSERDRVDDAVRLQALLLNTVQQAVIATDMDGVISSWNPYAEQLYGWRADEAVGLPQGEVLGVASDSAAAAVEAAAQAALSRGESWTGEVAVTCRDGRRVTVIATRTPMLDSAGLPVGVVGVSTDVTEQRSLQEQLRQSQKMEAVGMLAGGVAHDFNNMLTVIAGNVGLLMADTAKDDPQRADLVEIRDASERAAALTRQLLAFSRRQILKPQGLQLGALVDGMLPMLKRLLGEDVELHARSTGRPGNVEADPGQLEQVLMNLVVNARDAMPAGGRISIETGEVEFDGSQWSWEGSLIPAGYYQMLAVSDTGSGMPPEVKDRIFEPFFTTKPVGRGTGLGLSTVYGIVRQSGGYLWVHSETDVGSVFKIYLPVTTAAALAADAPAATKPTGGVETVLLVEDEDAVRLLARRVLVRAGYTVLECRNGAEAIEAALEHGGRIQLVVMDVVMPHVSGHAAALRLEHILDRVPVIFMSGYTDDEVLRRGVLTSEGRFLQKPFTPFSLLELARATLDQAALRAPQRS